MTVAAKVSTAVWRQNLGETDPTAIIDGVALTPPIGAHLRLDGVQYEVAEVPDIEYTSSTKNDGQLLVVVVVVEVEEES